MTAAKHSAADLLARISALRIELDDALFGVDNADGELEAGVIGDFANELRAQIAAVAAQLDAAQAEVRAARLSVKPSQSDLSRSQRARVLGALRGIKAVHGQFIPASHRAICDAAREALRAIEGANDGFSDPAIDEAARIARNCRDLAESHGEAAAAIAAESCIVPAGVCLAKHSEDIRVRQVRAGVCEAGPQRRAQKVFGAPAELR